jgi:hypothetical protein
MHAKVILVCILIICLQGCSAKFSYNNTDCLSNWCLDDYFDLNVDQKCTLKKELEWVLEWHRANVLAKYKQPNELRVLA